MKEDEMFEILVIDDTKSVHSFLKWILSATPGVNISGAMNGSEGIQALSSGKAFDLVLLDWEMPVLNGPRTFDKMKELGITVPVIMMTTKNAPEDIERMLSAGVSEYLMKPFTADILLEKIEFATGRALKNAA